MPHRKTGRKCFLCQKEFVATSATFTISIKEAGLIVHHAVCGPCHHAFMGRGE